MNRIKFVCILIILGIIPTGYLRAQDHHLSQFDEEVMLLNPAMTGKFDGSYRAHLHYRSQWGSLVSKAFRTESLSFEKPKKKFGFGAFILNNHAGAGNFNVFSFYLSTAYEVTIDPNEVQHLFCGIQLGFVQNSIDVSKLTFDNQFTVSNGGGFDPSLSSGENFVRTSSTSPDVNFGVYYCMQRKLNYFNPTMYKTSTLNPYAGISGYHLVQTKMRFTAFDNKQYRRIVLYGGSKYKLSKEICLDPQLFYMRQDKSNEFIFGLNAYYYYAPYQSFGSLGIHFRTRDALALNLAVLFREYKIRVSYDLNVSKLRKLESGVGGFEISFTYTKFDEKSYPMF